MFISLSPSLSLSFSSLTSYKILTYLQISSNISTRQPGQLKAEIDGDIARLSGINILSRVLLATSHGYRERTHAHTQKVVSSQNRVVGQFRSQSESLVDRVFIIASQRFKWFNESTETHVDHCVACRRWIPWMRRWKTGKHWWNELVFDKGLVETGVQQAFLLTSWELWKMITFTGKGGGGGVVCVFPFCFPCFPITDQKIKCVGCVGVRTSSSGCFCRQWKWIVALDDSTVDRGPPVNAQISADAWAGQVVNMYTNTSQLSDHETDLPHCSLHQRKRNIVCLYLHVHFLKKRTHDHTCMQACRHAGMQACMHACISTYTYTHVYIYIYIYTPLLHTHIYIYIQNRMWVCLLYTHIHTQTSHTHR